MDGKVHYHKPTGNGSKLRQKLNLQTLSGLKQMTREIIVFSPHKNVGFGFYNLSELGS